MTMLRMTSFTPWLFRIAALTAMLLLPSLSARADDDIPTKEALAAFFGVSPDAVHVECVHGMTLGDNGQTLHVCLKPEDHQRRCEVSLNVLGMSPEKFNRIKYQIRTEGDYADRTEWFAMTQIHSFPDKGESWRCPVTALEMMQGRIRMFNRWDASPISKTSGNNCTEPGSSIQSRTLFENVAFAPQQWHDVAIDAKLMATEPGEIRVTVDGKTLADVVGPDTYNDQRGPFLKFGIYKPTSWEANNPGLCVSYRRVAIESAKKPPKVKK